MRNKNGMKFKNQVGVILIAQPYLSAPIHNYGNILAVLFFSHKGTKC